MTYCINNENVAELGMLNLQKGAKIEYLEIDNSLTNQQCKYALDKKLNIVANCFRYCENYNYWYFGKPLYRNIGALAKIFQNLDLKIFKGKINFKIDPPKALESLPIFEISNNNYNIFDYFNYVFKDNKGIPE